MKFSEYIQYDAIGLADLIKKKSIAPSELLKTVIGFVEAINPKINAITTQLYDYAFEQIKTLDLEKPLAGVPFLLKDLGALCENTITTNACRFYTNFMGKHDSEIVRRYKKAGLIIFGKTNTPEYGLSGTTESALLGPCLNPWDASKIAGGSSGGAAAAVASRLVPAAYASDGGGSIRIPASCCGVFGLKPNRARVPMGPDFGEGWAGLVALHAISVTVRDSALLLDLTAGPETGDPYAAPNPDVNFSKALEKKLRPLKIAYSDTLHGMANPADPECLTAMRQAANLCESFGHHVEIACPEFNSELITHAVKIITSANTLANLNLRSKEMGRKPLPNELEKTTTLFLEAGEKFNSADYATALIIMHSQARQIAKFFEKYDTFITPTLARPPADLGTLNNANTLDEYFKTQHLFSPYTLLWNTTGQPAMSVPLYWLKSGLPIGVQFVAPLGEEATLFQLARQLEEAKPWQQIYPELVKQFLA